ncbi:dTMP kinase [Actinoplanes sp. NPDC051859]|uniref:dTMP kinase n=1 Tax=Actinoplanes sp. NPDC051859 TaxID=3363909 RepID=UPI0037A4C2B9
MLLVIEGIDGAGKSTVAALVARRLGDRGHRGKKEVDETDTATAVRVDALRDLIWNSPEARRDGFGATHWILLIAAWYAALPRLRADLADDHPDVRVMDGWYYRNIVKTVIREPCDPAWVESLFVTAPQPALVVLLDLPPEVAWSRRPHFHETELGRWDGFTGEPRASFVGYQERVRAGLLEMAADRGWLVLRLDATQTPDQIADIIIDHTIRREEQS